MTYVIALRIFRIFRFMKKMGNRRENNKLEMFRVKMPDFCARGPQF